MSGALIHARGQRRQVLADAIELVELPHPLHQDFLDGGVHLVRDLALLGGSRSKSPFCHVSIR